MGHNPRHIVGLSQVYKEDEDLVGKKARELGMLWKLGIPLPNGFVITTDFFKEFLRMTGIGSEIKKTRALSHPSISDSIKKLFHPIQKQIIHLHIPQVLAAELHKFYRELSGVFSEQSLSVFSSTFNNKSIVFPNIKGDANLILKIKTIWSLSPEEPVAIVVQKNIKSEMGGEIFTDNPVTDKRLSEKQMKKLVEYCKIIQKHFYFPKEIEYVVKKDKIFITKVNPFTGAVSELPKQSLDKRIHKVLMKGISINPGIVTGRVKILHNRHNYIGVGVKKGEIAILNNLESSLFKKIKNAKAIVVDSILANSLDKTLYRKYFQVPTVEGVRNATKMFQNGNVITVNGASGEIYSGGLIY